MLPFETLLALASFAFVTSITPGPNNIMLTASGVNYGFRATVPHLLGISAGFFLLLLAVGAGVGSLVMAAPGLRLALQLAGCAYMLWLAFRLATAPVADGSAQAGEDAARRRDGRGRPLTPLEACLFQWVNIKAVIMAVGAMTVYVRPDHALADVLQVAVVFTLVNLPCLSVWAGFGHVLGARLAEPRRLRWFNRLMGLLLLASIAPMLLA